MLLQQRQEAAFKQWLLLRFKKMHNAEPRALADRMVQLLAAERAEATIIQDCTVAISGFFPKHTRRSAAHFARDAMDALHTGRWKPGYRAKRKSRSGRQHARELDPALQSPARAASPAAVEAAHVAPSKPPARPIAQAQDGTTRAADRGDPSASIAQNKDAVASTHKRMMTPDDPPLGFSLSERSTNAPRPAHDPAPASIIRSRKRKAGDPPVQEHGRARHGDGAQDSERGEPQAKRVLRNMPKKQANRIASQMPEGSIVQPRQQRHQEQGRPVFPPDPLMLAPLPVPPSLPHSHASRMPLHATPQTPMSQFDNLNHAQPAPHNSHVSALFPEPSVGAQTAGTGQFSIPMYAPPAINNGSASALFPALYSVAHPPAPGQFDTPSHASPVINLDNMGAFGIPTVGAPPPFMGQPSTPNAVLPSLSNSEGKHPCMLHHLYGICPLRAFCPYKHHDRDSVTPSDGPKRATPAVSQKPTASQPSSQLSEPLMATTKSGCAKKNATVLVGNIPEEHLEEGEIASHFIQFGDIEGLQVSKDSRRAVVRFRTQDAADRACQCVKAVFDNRFVTVELYRPKGQLQSPIEGEHVEGTAGPPLDREAIELQQKEAQQAFEERRRRREELAAEAADIEGRLRATASGLREVQFQLAQKVKRTGEARVDEAKSLDEDLLTLLAEAEGLFRRGEAGGGQEEATKEVGGEEDEWL